MFRRPQPMDWRSGAKSGPPDRCSIVSALQRVVEPPRPAGAPAERGPEEWEVFEEPSDGAREVIELFDQERQDETRAARRKVNFDDAENEADEWERVSQWTQSRLGYDRPWREHAKQDTDAARAMRAIERATGFATEDVQALRSSGRPSAASVPRRERLDDALALLLGRFSRDALGQALGIAGQKVEKRAKDRGWRAGGITVTYRPAEPQATRSMSRTDWEREMDERSAGHEQWLRSLEDRPAEGRPEFDDELLMDS